MSTPPWIRSMQPPATINELVSISHDACMQPFATQLAITELAMHMLAPPRVVTHCHIAMSAHGHKSQSHEWSHSHNSEQRVATQTVTEPRVVGDPMHGRRATMSQNYTLTEPMWSQIHTVTEPRVVGDPRVGTQPHGTVTEPRVVGYPHDHKATDPRSQSHERYTRSQSHEWSQSHTITEPRVVAEPHDHRATSGPKSTRSQSHECSQNHECYMGMHMITKPRVVADPHNHRAASGRRSTRSQSHELSQSHTVTEPRVVADPHDHRATSGKIPTLSQSDEW